MSSRGGDVDMPLVGERNEATSSSVPGSSMLTHEATAGTSSAAANGASDQKLVQLSSEDPFDWEAYIGTYQGRGKIARLMHIARVCPQLRGPTAQLALDTYKVETLDTAGYEAALDLLNSHGGRDSASSKTVPGDGVWLKNTSAKANQEGEKLDLELRNYQNNLIKESIRMANRDLAEHFKKCGQLSEALKCYQRTREFCSTNEHIVEMCLDIIEVALELQKYDVVSHSVAKAEGVLESYDPAAAAAAAASSSANGGARGSMSGAGSAAGLNASAIGPAGKGATTSGADAIGALFRAGGSAGADANRSRPAQGSGVSGDSAQARVQRHVAEIEARLKIAHALAALGTGRYDAAALLFLAADHECMDCYSNLLAPAEVALYGVLCAIAMFPRAQLKSSVMDRASFRGFMEYEPHTRDLLEAFWNCDYRKGLALLDHWKSRHLLDLYLYPHLETLTRLITRRCLQQFFLPFKSVSLTRLSDLFGWTMERTRSEVLQLVERNDIQAKLDWIDGVVVTDTEDVRAELFQQATDECQKRIDTARKLCFRMQLMKNGVVHREMPESDQSPPPQQQQS
ncbi:unnamed protein product [Parajaminaea phylloscopi]